MMEINIGKLNVLMAEKLLSKQELCNKANLSYTALANIYDGKSVTPKTIGKVAKALSVPVGEILQD